MAPRTLWSSCFGKHNHGGEGRHGEPDTADDGVGAAGPVLVEMFTSQGCRTSPTADLVLSRLGRGDFQLAVPVVILAFHVDYWDYVGWKDPFGPASGPSGKKPMWRPLGLTPSTPIRLWSRVRPNVLELTRMPSSNQSLLRLGTLLQRSRQLSEGQHQILWK